MLRLAFIQPTLGKVIGKQTTSTARLRVRTILGAVEHEAHTCTPLGHSWKTGQWAAQVLAPVLPVHHINAQKRCCCSEKLEQKHVAAVEGINTARPGGHGVLWQTAQIPKMGFRVGKVGAAAHN